MSEENQYNGDEHKNEPEIWDEQRWEEFFKESDRRTDIYSNLLDKYMDHPDRDRIIAEEMGWTHMLDEIDDEHEEWMDEFVIDEYGDGEEWKRNTDYEPSEIDSFQDLPLYQKAFEFSIDAMNMSNKHLKDSDDESVTIFCHSITVPAAKIAGGFGFGFELDSLGGNIANCKRGLIAANRMLEALHEIGKKELLEREIYLEFHGRAKEVRDELAIYIVDLRKRFQRGIL